jgi:hypothetical protein
MPYQDQVTQRKFEVAVSSAPKKISKIQFGKEQRPRCYLTMNHIPSESVKCLFSEVKTACNQFYICDGIECWEAVVINSPCVAVMFASRLGSVNPSALIDFCEVHKT